MGTPPQEYLLVKAARYLGVAPWELAERNPSWMHMALEFESAELAAQAQASRSSKTPASSSGKKVRF